MLLFAGSLRGGAGARGGGAGASLALSPEELEGLLAEAEAPSGAQDDDRVDYAEFCSALLAHHGVRWSLLLALPALHKRPASGPRSTSFPSGGHAAAHCSVCAHPAALRVAPQKKHGRLDPSPSGGGSSTSSMSPKAVPGAASQARLALLSDGSQPPSHGASPARSERGSGLMGAWWPQLHGTPHTSSSVGGTDGGGGGGSSGMHSPQSTAAAAHAHLLHPHQHQHHHSLGGGVGGGSVGGGRRRSSAAAYTSLSPRGHFTGGAFSPASVPPAPHGGGGRLSPEQASAADLSPPASSPTVERGSLGQRPSPLSRVAAALLLDPPSAGRGGGAAAIQPQPLLGASPRQAPWAPFEGNPTGSVFALSPMLINHPSTAAQDRHGMTSRSGPPDLEATPPPTTIHVAPAIVPPPPGNNNSTTIGKGGNASCLDGPACAALVVTPLGSAQVDSPSVGRASSASQAACFFLDSGSVSRKSPKSVLERYGSASDRESAGSALGLGGVQLVAQHQQQQQQQQQQQAQGSAGPPAGDVLPAVAE